MELQSSLYYTSYVRNERRVRNKHGCTIPYQCLAQFDLLVEYFQRAFPRFPRAWSRIKVPRGCFAELPPVFTYKRFKLMDTDSGWWVVAYKKCAAKTATFILYEVYDQFRL